MSDTAVMDRPVIIATKPQKCRFCSRRFVPYKDEITRIPGRGWVHAGCANAIDENAPAEEGATQLATPSITLNLWLPKSIDLRTIGNTANRALRYQVFEEEKANRIELQVEGEMTMAVAGELLQELDHELRSWGERPETFALVGKETGK